MRALRCLVAVLLVLGLAAPAMADSHENALMKEVADLGDKLAEAMVNKDWEMLLGMYTEDAISLPNFGPRMQGIEQFRAHNEMMQNAGMKINSFESDPTEAWQAGDHIIEIGTFAIALEMPGMPTEIKDKGKYMTVYVRDDEGNLKIKAETWNTDMNPMEMMGGMGEGAAPADDMGDDMGDDEGDDEGDDGDDG